MQGWRPDALILQSFTGYQGCSQQPREGQSLPAEAVPFGLYIVLTGALPRQ